jgi:hypothetical protein
MNARAAPATIDLQLTVSREQAQVLHWFLRHIAFDDAYQRTPPHLGKAVRTEGGYEIMTAACRVQLAIEAAEIHGDGWMYRGRL